MAQTVKRLPTMRETWVRSGWEDLLEKEMATHSSTLAGKSHGQRSLVGYSPLGRKESDTTERLHSLLAESSNPSTDLHVAVHGVAKSGTQLSGWTTTKSLKKLSFLQSLFLLNSLLLNHQGLKMRLETGDFQLMVPFQKKELSFFLKKKISLGYDILKLILVLPTISHRFLSFPFIAS